MERLEKRQQLWDQLRAAKSPDDIERLASEMRELFKIEVRSQKAIPVSSKQHETLFGDAVEAYLKAHGITAKYEEVRRRFGYPPGCTGCEERKQWLNRVHAWWKSVNPL